jgi:hypothetical protein
MLQAPAPGQHPAALQLGCQIEQHPLVRCKCIDPTIDQCGTRLGDRGQRHDRGTRQLPCERCLRRTALADTDAPGLRVDGLDLIERDTGPHQQTEFELQQGRCEIHLSRASGRRIGEGQVRLASSQRLGQLRGTGAFEQLHRDAERIGQCAAQCRRETDSFPAARIADHRRRTAWIGDHPQHAGGCQRRGGGGVATDRRKLFDRPRQIDLRGACGDREAFRGCRPCSGPPSRHWPPGQRESPCL